MRIYIRQAHWAQEKSILLRIRHTVFVEEQGVPPELEPDAHDAQAVHLLALTAADVPIGTVRMTTEGAIGRMAVLRPWRGQGIGTRLLQQLLDTAEARTMEALYLHAQVHARNFYERQGFVAHGATFMEAGISHQLMLYKAPA